MPGMSSIEILDRLVGFPTVSRQSNLGLMAYVSDYLSSAGIESRQVAGDYDDRTNLFATVGPADRPGVLLSGHTDVVPAMDQPGWSVEPFRLTRRNGWLMGRGTADMKGFVACALAAAGRAARRGRLRSPLHLALSCDEEIGCLGVRDLIPAIAAAQCRPAFCIVGEPTSMAVATGHKGKAAFHVDVRGTAGHSALAPLALNAIHLGADLVSLLRQKQADLAERGPRDSGSTVPWTTVHVGLMSGGTQLNIVPDRCSIDFEIRHVAADDPGAIRAEVEAAAARLIAPHRGQFPECGITVRPGIAYPGLDTPADADVVRFVRSLAETGALARVDFGTEGGLFSERLEVPTVVCGPGSMEQGHRPDEFITFDQMARCDRMMESLLQMLERGL